MAGKEKARWLGGLLGHYAERLDIPVIVRSRKEFDSLFSGIESLVHLESCSYSECPVANFPEMNDLRIRFAIMIVCRYCLLHYADWRAVHRSFLFASGFVLSYASSIYQNFVSVNRQFGDLVKLVCL